MLNARPRRGLARLAACLLAAGLLPAPAGAATSFGDVVVAVEPEPKGDSSHGYAEYWVVVTNRSGQESHAVTLTLPRPGYAPPGDHLRAASRSVEVGPGATVRVALLQPGYPVIYGNGLEVRIDGRVQEAAVPLNVRTPRGLGYSHRGYLSSPGSTVPLVLASPGVRSEFLDRARQA